MKKYLILLLFLFSCLNIQSQNDFATINIYRTKAFCIGDCTVNVYLNDTYLCEIENGGKLELKVFNVKSTKISIAKEKWFKDDIILSLRKGETYYLNSQARTPRFKGFKLVQLSESIKPKKLDAKKFVFMSDMGVLDNNRSSKPDTDWTRNKLKEHWSEKYPDDIEGIYEKIGAYLEYELAVIKENSEYKIIYLSGATGTNWNEGDIKATMQKTATFGIFKSNWYMLNKTFNDNVILTFDKSLMEYLSESGKDKKIQFLKIFPTYDDTMDAINKTSDWKDSGTGFFINEIGYIATNYHVIENAKAIQIEFLHKGNILKYNAEVVHSDINNDISIIKIDESSFETLDELPYRFNTEISDVGSEVFTLGYPLTEAMGDELKFSPGYISANSGFKGNIAQYQISVPLQPGNSGGPLFDKEGNLIGITSSRLEGGSNPQNVNYAIKSSYLTMMISMVSENVELPNSNILIGKDFSDQYKILSNYVVKIKVK